jgi:hypothetical protein
MIINDLDVNWAGRAFRPFETNPPLVINADAVLALSAALEGLQSVAGQGGKVFQAPRSVQPVEPDFSLSPEAREFPNVPTTSKAFGFSVAVIHDHK